VSESEIINRALRLPVRKRERLAEALLGSVKRPSRRHVEALWVQEAESRVDGLLAGKIKTVPGEKVLAYRGKRR
jgi:putative addiction module component (TIGR02574 family)